MKLAFALFLALPLGAAPIHGGACGTGSYDQYIALGSTGCQFGSYTWSDFYFYGTTNATGYASNGGVRLNPADLAISFKTLPFDFEGFTATAPWSVEQGKLLTLYFSFSVTGPIFGIFSEVAVNIPAQEQMSQIGCMDGYMVANAGCSGTALAHRDRYVLDSPVGAFGLWTVYQCTGSDGTTTLQAIEGVVHSSSAEPPTPEPGTWFLTLAGLMVCGFMGWRRSALLQTAK